MRAHKGVLVCGEIVDGRLASVTRELLGIGQKLSDELGQETWAALIGSTIPAELAQECIYFGADRVYVLNDPLFKDYLADLYVAGLEKLVRELKPDIFIFGQTSMGRDVAPRLAYRLDTGVTLDCIELSLDQETGFMLQTKPVYGGNACAVYVCQAKPQIASIRVKTMPAAERNEFREGEVIFFSPDIDASATRVRLVKRVKEEIAGIKLEDADVVVCGGRGVGGPEGFEELGELARLLKGAVGATRPPCEDGWAPAQSQIGLTGKIVSPKLYIGVALSGSSQHIAGMKGSKNIVAINKDPEANIFTVAHYGAIGDYRKVLSGFIEKFKEGL